MSFLVISLFSDGLPILWISILCFLLSLRCTGRALCFFFYFYSLCSKGVFWIIPYINFESLESVRLISERISQDLR